MSGTGEGGDEVVQSGVELGDLCCGGAFLGAEHGCCAGESEQRAGDVAGDDGCAVISVVTVGEDTAVHPRYISPGHRCQRLPEFVVKEHASIAIAAAGHLVTPQ